MVSCFRRAAPSLEAIPCSSKDAHSTKAAIHDVCGPTTPKLLYSDNARELVAAGKALGWWHDYSTDNRPASNGVVERQNRNVLEGLRSILLESGLEHKFWSQAVQCWCFLNNTTRVHEKDNMTPYQRRHGKKVKFEGQQIAFGAKIHYLPTADREVRQRHKAGPRMVECLFAGYKQRVDGKWSGE